MIRTGAAFTLNSGTEHSDVWGYNDRNELTVSKRFDDVTVPLSSGADTVFDRDYAYDPIGNRTSYDGGTDHAAEYYCVNNVNQYTSIDDDSSACPGDDELPAYDSDGNLTQDADFDYAYDGENRLISVTPRSPGSGDRKVTYTYDYMGVALRRRNEVLAQLHRSILFI